MSSNNKILLICPKNSTRAPRLYNVYSALKEDYEIKIIGDSKPNYINDDNFIELNTSSIDKYSFIKRVFFKLKYLFYLVSLFPLSPKHFKYLLKTSSIELFSIIKSLDFDIIQLHHIELLPILIYYKKKRSFKLVLNIHEYYPKEFDDQKTWVNMFEYWDELCRSFFQDVDLFLSVNESISNEFIVNYKLRKEKFISFFNVKEFQNISPSIISPSEIKLIHHGAAIPSRQIDKMIEMMNFLPENYSLTLMLVPSNEKYYKTLLSMQTDKIKIIDPVDFINISKVINKYDIGLYLLTPSNFNEKHSLPNKFFEFIQARLCLAISPLTEMKNIVQQNKIGVVCETFKPADMAEKIRKQNINDIKRFKENSHRCALIYSSGHYKNILLNALSKL